jgi:hypothetical protein
VTEAVRGEVVCTSRTVTVIDDIVTGEPTLETPLDAVDLVTGAVTGEVVCTPQAATVIEPASGDRLVLDNLNSPDSGFGDGNDDG